MTVSRTMTVSQCPSLIGVTLFSPHRYCSLPHHQLSQEPASAIVPRRSKTWFRIQKLLVMSLSLPLLIRMFQEESGGHAVRAVFSSDGCAVPELIESGRRASFCWMRSR